ncbi:hypothetical protein O0235_00690 [Tepidiforma flava]|uniref:Uncharacterized protein n=1 Tax=Tepidiforma flava TaxID=3004094 RepID=A0ABY7M6K9_9CHLR|nr:hypothetical protein [Tepidiforma flava]WBL36171.1 hypothetical protein O0235_00690 [Tepidiforma flava]
MRCWLLTLPMVARRGVRTGEDAGGELFGGRMGVEFAAGDALGQGFDDGRGRRLANFFEDKLLGDGQELVAGILGAVRGELAGGLEVGAVVVDGIDERAEAFTPGRDGLENRRAALVGRREREEGLQLADEDVGAGVVGFVDDEDIGDFDDAGLERLDVIAGAGVVDEDGGHGGAGDFDFVLAGADGLDDDVVEAEGVDDGDDVGDGRCEAAERAAAGHGAHVDAGIHGDVLHADAVAEEGAVGEGAGGIDGDDGDGLAAAAKFGCERAGESALSGAGAAGDADDVGAAGVREEGADVIAAFEGAVFDAGDDAGERAAVAREEALDELVHVTSSRCRRRT